MNSDGAKSKLNLIFLSYLAIDPEISLFKLQINWQMLNIQINFNKMWSNSNMKRDSNFVGTEFVIVFMNYQQVEFHALWINLRWITLIAYDKCIL